MGSLAKKSQAELERELEKNKKKWKRQGILDIGVPPIFSIEIYWNTFKKKVIFKQIKGGFDGKMIECSFPHLPATADNCLQSKALGEVIEYAMSRIGLM